MHSQWLEIDRAALEALCSEYDLDLLILFGSQVTGATHSESDTDVGMVRRPGRLAADHFLDMQARLSQILHKRDVDLVDLGRVSGLLRHIACERGILLYQSASGTFARFRVQAWNQYQDERIQIRRHDSEAIRTALRSLTR